MLDEAEYAEVYEALRTGARWFDEERERRGLRPDEPLGLTGEGLRERRFGPMLNAYERITGYRETNPNAVFHHRISLYGGPCPACGKPLRTPKARYCAACGYGKDAIATDPRPLVEREPERLPRTAEGPSQGRPED